VRAQSREQHRGPDIESKEGTAYESGVLLLVAHGSRDPAGLRAVSEIVAAVRARRPGLDVRLASIEMVPPDIRTALGSVPAGPPVVVVPLLLSSGYHDRVDIRAAVDEVRPDARQGRVLGPDPLLAVALADRLADVGWLPADAVVLAAAGSSEPGVVASVREQAGLLAVELAGRGADAARVTVAFGSAAEPGVPAAVTGARAAGATRVAIAPYLLAPGFFATRLHLAGADLVAAPLGAHPTVVDLVLRRHREAS
jgi:sirohydrochlorin ferrochelatase